MVGQPPIGANRRCQLEPKYFLTYNLTCLRTTPVLLTRADTLNG
jgi:hypothetical protein